MDPPEVCPQDGQPSPQGAPQTWGSGALCWSHMQMAVLAALSSVHSAHPTNLPALGAWPCPSPGQTPQWGRPAGHGATRGAAGLCQGPFPAAQAPGSWSHSLSWAAPTRHWAGPEGQGPAWHPAPRGCSGPGSGEDGEYSPPTGEGKHCTGARCRGQFTPARSRHNPGGLPGGGLTGSLPLVCGHQSDRRSGPGFSLPTGSSRHMASGTGGHGTGVSRGVGPVLGCAL